MTRSILAAAAAAAAILVVAPTPAAARAGPVEKAQNAYDRGDYETALRRWTKGAGRGDVISMEGLGRLWEGGLTAATPKSDEEAEKWYLKAAQRIWTPAMVRLALLQLRTGRPEPARAWLVEAARWNSQPGIAALQELGWPVPEPDLAIAQQALTAQQQAARNQLLLGIAGVAVCAAGGCGARAPAPAAPAGTPLRCKATGAIVLGSPVYRCE